MPPGNIFLIMQNAAKWAIFIIFVRPLGGATLLEPPVSPHTLESFSFDVKIGAHALRVHSCSDLAELGSFYNDDIYELLRNSTFLFLKIGKATFKEIVC